MFRRTFAALLVFVLAAGEFPARAAGVSALGVVTLASGASLARSQVSPGASVYDGDSFQTSANGLLRVRTGAAQFYLASQGAVILHSTAGGALVTLTLGTVVFSSAKAAALDVEIAQAHIRPAADQPTVAQISVTGPKTMEVRAKRGSLQFSYQGETQFIPEGAAYGFILDPSQQAATPAPSPSNPFPKQKEPGAPSRQKKGFLYFVIGAVSALPYFAVDEALESPSKP